MASPKSIALLAVVARADLACERWLKRDRLEPMGRILTGADMALIYGLPLWLWRCRCCYTSWTAGCVC